jgi:trehalose 6-phosphate synthase/phosphatase
MQSYTEKTDGAFMEEKESMIVWNYKDTDPEFGNWQAKELTSHLEHVFANIPIEVVHTKKSLEVVPTQLKKQKFVKVLIDTLSRKYPFDFVMYIGEDLTNEHVFTYLNGKKHKPGKELQGVSLFANR